MLSTFILWEIFLYVKAFQTITYQNFSQRDCIGQNIIDKGTYHTKALSQ